MSSWPPPKDKFGNYRDENGRLLTPTFTTGAQSLYSYDEHGNVKQLAQILPGLKRPKFIHYEYDLISGNVNCVWYQKFFDKHFQFWDKDQFVGKKDDTKAWKDNLRKDQFAHRYFYDADNRITRVQTSRDGKIWNTDAKYHYYAHGPLARVELGEFNVQGLDYYYNLQGWIKGVNTLGGQDIGKDAQSGINENVSADAFAYQLNYFAGDYRSIQGASTTPAPTTSLYNGNIGAMLTDLKTKGGENVAEYTYDQLNRIKSATSPAFGTNYSYDADGNLQQLNRDGGSINYTYGKANQLDRVNGSLNIAYEYDEIGNLKLSEENGVQDTIKWTVYGKVAQVIRKKGTDFMTINYRYDGSGNRVMKLIEKRMSGTIEFTTTHYIRDATGNIMATYTNRKVQEIHLYGSSRLGTYKIPYEPDTKDPTKQVQVNDFHKLILGRRYYELTNHLGNVLAVISDKKILNGTTFEADVVSANDYYPFGMTIASRTFQTEEYRFGFQGQETEKELFGGNGSFFKYRISDNRLGRFFAIDPLFRKYPWYTPYQFSGNKLIAFRELEGLEETESTKPDDYMATRSSDITNTSAWAVFNQWNDNYIDKYNQFSVTQAQKYRDKYCTFTCEDLSLQILIDFASENNLPVKITNETYPDGLTPSDINHITDFTNELLATTGAKDVYKNTTEVGKGMNGLKNAQVGNMVLLDTDADGLSDNHVQLVKEKTSNNEVIVLQGNMGRYIPQITRGKIHGSNNPSSWLYTGGLIGQAIYWTEENRYEGMGESNNVENDYSPSIRQWNFYSFNKPSSIDNN